MTSQSLKGDVQCQGSNPHALLLKPHLHPSLYIYFWPWMRSLLFGVTLCLVFLGSCVNQIPVLYCCRKWKYWSIHTEYTIILLLVFNFYCCYYCFWPQLPSSIFRDLLVELEGLYGVPEIEPGSASCKTSTLSAVLSLLPPLAAIFKGKHNYCMFRCIRRSTTFPVKI